MLPCTLTASKAYAEQDGWYLQTSPYSGLMKVR